MERNPRASARETGPDRLTDAPWTSSPTRPDAEPLHPGDVIHEKYVVDRLLYTGVETEIYAGWQSPLERPVVLKVLRAEAATDPRVRGRFEREVRALSAIDHERVVKVYEAGELPSGRRVAVLESVPGRTLRERPFRMDQILESVGIAIQVLDALRVVHDAGFAYLGLEPGNVVLVPSGAAIAVKLVDLGAVQPLGAARSRRSGGSVTALRSPYTAPEHERDASVSVRADLYAVGVLLHGMLTGLPPSSEVLLVPPSELAPGVSLRLDGAVLALLASAPDDRPFDANHAIGMLRSAIRITKTPAPVSRAEILRTASDARTELPAAHRPRVRVVSSTTLAARLVKDLVAAGVDATLDARLPTLAELALDEVGRRSTVVLDSTQSLLDPAPPLRLLAQGALTQLLELTRPDARVGQDPRIRRFPLPLAGADVAEIIALVRGDRGT